MPNVTLNFNHDINVSVQIGDVAYYVSTFPTPGQLPGQVITNSQDPPDWASTTTPHMTQVREEIIMIGPIIDITVNSITCDMPDNLAAQYGPPPPGAFIMFSKDNKANLSSILGYYSILKLRNNSKTKGELFAIGADFIESSK